LAELEEFISTPGCCANILDTGDRTFDEGLYEAAKILYSHISNFAKLASALVKLHDFAGAIESANKANSIRTWKEVNLACVEAKDFRLAQIAGLHIIIQPDELEELLGVYETRGHFAELIQLMETGLQNENAHVGMYTELAGLYSKYREEKLMDYLKAQYTKINIPKVIHYCQMNSQWPELVFLYIHYDEFDKAAQTMITHSADAWEPALFKDVISKVSNIDICYNAVQFYLSEYPLIINDLMTAMVSKVDHSRVVQLVKRMNHLALIKPYLSSVQEKNIQAVNEALNSLYIDEADYESLRNSIDHYDAYDPIPLAQSIETHELLEFRRVAAYIYKKQQRWAQSVELSKTDRLFKDAIETAAESRKQDVCEGLLEYFVEKSLKECFAACLYTCYDSVRPDVALELAWKNKILDFAFPFIIQVVREYTSKVDMLHREYEKKKKEAEQKDKQPDAFTQPAMPEEHLFMNQVPQIAYYPANTYVQPGVVPGVQPGVAFGVMPGATFGAPAPGFGF